MSTFIAETRLAMTIDWGLQFPLTLKKKERWHTTVIVGEQNSKGVLWTWGKPGEKPVYPNDICMIFFADRRSLDACTALPAGWKFFVPAALPLDETWSPNKLLAHPAHLKLTRWLISPKSLFTATSALPLGSSLKLVASC